MLIYVLTPTSEYYILLSQGCPLNLIHFSIMSLLLISDIMFLIDYTYYYITLDCFINVRLEKNKYYTIIEESNQWSNNTFPIFFINTLL